MMIRAGKTFRAICRNEGDRHMPNYVAYIYRSRCGVLAERCAILESDGRYG